MLTDEAQAQIKQFKALAEQGDIDAQFSLGMTWDLGTERWKWLCRAAHRNDPRAQTAFAEAFARADGDPFAPIADKDFIQVYLWYSLAASNGNLRAGWSRRDFTEKMSAEEIAEAERRVTAWKPDPASCDGLQP